VVAASIASATVPTDPIACGLVPTLPYRLPAEIEYPFVRAACRMRPRTQRLLFGAPPAIDGQVLATDMQAILRLAQLTGHDMLTGGLPPEEARAYILRSAAATRGAPLPMAEVRELTFPSPAGALPARLYVPLGARPAPRPLLIYFHGGGWVVGNLETHDSACRFLAAHSGVAILSPTYRLSPEHPFPAAVEDAHAAYLWAVGNAADFDADPTLIGIGGDSAGGNLAAVVTVAMRDADGPPPAMQLLIYPATEAVDPRPSRSLFANGFILTQTDIDICERHYLPEKSMGYDPRASVLRTPDLSGLPPAYVATAGFDPLRDEGEEYARRMAQAGVRVAVRRHPRLVHTFANLTDVSSSARQAMLEAAGALRMGLS
jgi:acetyl esterase